VRGKSGLRANTEWSENFGQRDQIVFNEVGGVCEETVGERFVEFQYLQE
jgi:hypothetical protein